MTMKQDNAITSSFFLGLLILSFPSNSFAQDLGAVLTSASDNTFSLTQLLSVTAYVAGAALVMSSIFRFIKVADGGGRVPVMDPILRFFGGGALVALPYMIEMAINSMYEGVGTSGERTSTSGLNFTPNSSLNALDEVMVNFVVKIYGPAKFLLQAICYVTGGVLGFNGILRLARSGQEGNAPSQSGTVGMFVASAALMSMAQGMDALTASLFGSAIPKPFTSLAYNNTTINTNSLNHLVQAAFAFVEIIGWIAFAKGILVLKTLSSGQSQKTHMNAFTHIVGGVIAVNLAQFVSLAANTLGIAQPFTP